MTRIRTLLLGFASSLMVASPSYAEDLPDSLGAEECFPTDDIAQALNKFDTIKASKRDTVGPQLVLTVELEDGEILPERMELRHGETATPILFDDRFRSVGLSDQLRAAPEGTEFCVVDPAREGRLRAESGYNVDIDMGVRFKSTSGRHSLEEIQDGLKDGRSHYKRLVGAMGFMIPKFDHVAVAGDDEDNPPNIVATAQGRDLGEPAFTLYEDGRLVALDALEEMGADGIRIEAKDYRLTPSPDAKALAKFSGD